MSDLPPLRLSITLPGELLPELSLGLRTVAVNGDYPAVVRMVLNDLASSIETSIRRRAEGQGGAATWVIRDG